MLFKPLLGTDLSGKVGGIVASHNRGGAYFRAATIPVNPNTVFQQVVRAAVAQLSAQWESTLTQVQRDAWAVYASNVTLTNRIGEQINVTPLDMYVRSNVSKQQAGIPRQDDAPTIFNLGAKTFQSVTNATVAGQTIDFNFAVTPEGDPWATEIGSFMLVYVSRPQNSGISFFRGPYRFAGSVEGAVIPPTPPLTVAVPFPIALGQRIFGRAVVTYLDGRYTTSSFSGTFTVA